MKTLITTFALCACLQSLGSVLQLNLNTGTNDTNYVTIPGGSAQVVGFETAMTDGAETGNTSLSIGRTVTGSIVHTDVEVHSATSVVAEADTLVNNYSITATFNADGHNNWVQSSIFSNCYANTTKTGTYSNTNGTSRITFRPGSGTKTLVPPTDFYLALTFFEDNKFNTNFTWAADQDEIRFSSGDGSPSYLVNITRRVPPMMKMRIATNIVTTATTNVWNEKVSRMVEIPVIAPTALVGGYLMAKPTSDTYVFAGDKLICTSPIATNKAGIVRAILKQ